jgi:signal peptidase
MCGAVELLQEHKQIRSVKGVLDKEIKPKRKPIVVALINIGIVLGAMVGIWFGFTVVFGTATPFFVVSSNSMYPVLQVGDIIVVTGNAPFSNLKVGDTIVFNEPGIGDKVIVHRVNRIVDSSARMIVTKGDNNYAPDDWRVTSSDYIGSVVFTVPKIGLLTTALTPPANYIFIIIVIAVVFILEIRSQRSEGEETPPTPDEGSVNPS